MDNIASRYSKADFLAYGSAVIEAHKKVIEVYKKVIYVAYGMDGKVLNKRFVDKVNEMVESDGARVVVSDTYGLGHKDFKIYLDKDYVSLGTCNKTIRNDIYGTYITSYGNDFSDDEGRITAVGIEGKCNKEIEVCEGQIKKWQDAIDNYDEYSARVANAMSQLAESFKGMNNLFVPYEIRHCDWCDK